jgi:hypothetical protein
METISSFLLPVDECLNREQLCTLTEGRVVAPMNRYPGMPISFITDNMLDF